MDERDTIRELEQELEDIGIGKVDSTADTSAASVSAAAPVTATASVAPTMPQQVTPTPVSTPASIPSATVAPVPTPPADMLVPPAALVTPDDQPESIIPPVPVSPEQSTPIQRDAQHAVMGQMLTRAIEKGKLEVPDAPDPLVAKPAELESWRVFKIMSEFVEGFEILRKYGLAATVFGSVRQKLAPRYYEDASALSGRLAKAGFAVITGGSAGIMEAANKGAFEAGGASIGLNIRLGNDQGMNKYLTDSLTFEHFFVRKVMLTFASEVYIYFPGGFGTLDEFTEIITLVQTGKIRRIPIVLYGKEYWEPLAKVFDEQLRAQFGTIDQADMDLYRIVDTVDEAYEYIAASTGLKDVR